MPITLQFGAWSPDQADTPIQVPDNQGPMMVPLADCLNVYFQNGAYKSIQSPVNSTINGNTIQALNAQALSAFSYYDNVAKQETIFVGTSGGIQQLNANGSWSNVPFISAQSVSLLGASFSFSAGNFLNTNTLIGQTLTFSTGVLSPLQTGVSFVAGLVTILGTQHVGYSGVAPTYGALITGSMFLGSLQQIFDGAGLSTLSLNCTTDPTVSGFTTMTTNGKTFQSSAAVYSYSATTKTATWAWPGPFGFATGSTFTVVFA